MAGIKGITGPPGNANAFKNGLKAKPSAFKHGIAAMDKARKQKKAVSNRKAKRFRAEFYESLIEDKGGEANVSAALKYHAEIIAHDASWLSLMIKARDNILRTRPKYQENIQALARLDGYIRPVINSLSQNLDRFGFDRVAPPQQTLAEYVAANYGAEDDDE
jgi:hypothetical protein